MVRLASCCRNARALLRRTDKNKDIRFETALLPRLTFSQICMCKGVLLLVLFLRLELSAASSRKTLLKHHGENSNRGGLHEIRLTKYEIPVLVLSDELVEKISDGSFTASEQLMGGKPHLRAARRVDREISLCGVLQSKDGALVLLQ